MSRRIAKPGYRLTRQAFWTSFVLAWVVILLLIVGALIGSEGAIQVAPVAIPSMMMMVAALLGIHRVTGAWDMRSIAEAAAPSVDTNYPPDYGAPYAEGR